MVKQKQIKKLTMLSVIKIELLIPSRLDKDIMLKVVTDIQTNNIDPILLEAFDANIVMK